MNTIHFSRACINNYKYLINLSIKASSNSNYTNIYTRKGDQLFPKARKNRANTNCRFIASRVTSHFNLVWSDFDSLVVNGI